MEAACMALDPDSISIPTSRDSLLFSSARNFFRATIDRNPSVT